MSPKENQISAEVQQQAVQIQLPADLLTQLDEVKKQAQTLSWGNPDWLDEQLFINDLLLPEKWETDSELIKRANLLRYVIWKNPEWWNNWRNDFWVTWMWFEFRKWNVIFEINDSVATNSSIRDFPTIENFQYLWNFVQTSWHAKEILDFLWISQNALYIIQSKNNDGNFLKNAFSFKNWQTESLDLMRLNFAKKRFLQDTIPF